MKDLVSIITPIFNCDQFIEEAIKSVIVQTYKNWEMIIVDDFSTDNSLKIIKDFSKKESRIRLIQNKKNNGSGISRNKAIKIASGRYIAFLDSDDIWHKDKLKIQITLMKKNNWCFSHTSYGYISEKGETIKSTFHVSNKPVTYSRLLKRTEISCLTAVYDQELIGKFYMSNHKNKQDYFLWLSILKRGNKSYPIDTELGFYRQRKNSNTNQKSKLLLSHISFLMNTQKMNIFESIYYTSFWVMNGIGRYYFK